MDLNVKKFEELSTIDLYEIIKTRLEIFIVEQQRFYQDIDNVDYNALHFFFKEGDRVVAYLRASYEGDDNNTVRFSRIITLKHGKGWGRELMEKSITATKEKMKCKRIILNAQKYAVGFYEKFGFRTISNDFIYRNIVHVVMKLEF